VLNRRFRTAAALAVVVGGLALLWSMRGGQGAQYVSEFWMVDPYQPTSARRRARACPARDGRNAKLYVLDYVPAGFSGFHGPLAGLIGVLALRARWLGVVPPGVAPPRRDRAVRADVPRARSCSGRRSGRATVSRSR
jgi:hypothetical protein